MLLTEDSKSNLKNPFEINRIFIYVKYAKGI